MSPQNKLDFTRIQSSAPFFTGQMAIGSLLAGMIWVFATRVTLDLAGISVDVLSWVVLTPLVGCLALATWSLVKRKRFRSPVTSQDLLVLFEEVKSDLGKGHDIELWYRHADTQVFQCTGDPLSKAILFSQSAIADILKKREKGRVLLARAILEIEKSSRAARFLTGVLLFTLCAFFFGPAFHDLFTFLLFSLGVGMVVVIVLAFVGVTVAAIIMDSGRSTEIDKIVEQLYGTPVDVAVTEVFYGLHVADEMIEEERHDKKEDLSQRRIALRNAIIATVVVAPVSFFAFMYAHSASSLAVQLSLFLTIMTCGAAIAIVFPISYSWPLLVTGRKPRDTEWDIMLPLAEEVQDFLNRQEDYEKLRVQGVRTPFDEKAGLAILELKSANHEKTIDVVMPQMLEDLHDVELLGPLILAELKINEIEGGEIKIDLGVLGVTTSHLAIGLVWSVLVSEFYNFALNILVAMFIYFVITIIPVQYVASWRRKSTVKAEADIAKRYPRYREALQTLIKNHHTLPDGITSYKTRLERIDRYLGMDVMEDGSG